MSKKLLLIFSLLVSIFQAESQTKKFRPSDQKMLVKAGDKVEINADSAYIISASRALLLNEKLDELVGAQELNSELKSVNKELLSKIKEVDKLVSKILSRMESDNLEVNADFDQLLIELDANLDSMKENNKELASNNNQLKQQIAAMDATISKLKKEIRGIWWNGLADKIVVGIVGIGIGFIIGL